VALLLAVGYALLGLLGLVDFYLWGYDYGHNLDPTAPIKIPGMSYQPPLIGSKELLNFTAVSFPHVGGVALVLAGVLGICGVWMLWRSREGRRRSATSL
jgi:copper chaperone NosL